MTPSLSPTGETLKAPFPYFGGKAKIASKVWAALGNPKHYIEPFFGSGAVLLARPGNERYIESVNDKDGFVSNVWRSLQFSPDETAKWCDWPVNHCVPAGTMIETPNGQVPVEKVHKGMIVFGEADGYIISTEVKSTTVHKTTTPLHKVNELFLTGEHPVWTTRGYIAAKDLDSKDKIATCFDWPVDNSPINMVDCIHEHPKMDYLYSYRSDNGAYSICRSNCLFSKKTFRRAFIKSNTQGKNSPRLLDTLSFDQWPCSNYQGNRSSNRNELAGKRTLLDCRISKNISACQSHERRRRNSGNEMECRIQAEVFSGAEGCPVSTRQEICNVRQASYTGGNRENKASRYWSKINKISNRKNGCGKTRQATFSRTYCQACEMAYRKNFNTGTQKQNSCFNKKSKTSHLYRDRSFLSFYNSNCKSIACERSINKSIYTEGHPMPRMSLSFPVSVFNFETTTGNYFANKVLVHNCDLSARKRTLIKNEARLLENLIADDKWHDPVMAGYWIWAASCWIGSGLTSIGLIPHIGHGGKGVHAIGKRPHIGHGGKGVHAACNQNIYDWFNRLSERLRYVRVVCGDWTRVCGGKWQDKMGTCGMFFDPPYGVADRDTSVYHHDSTTVAADVMAWCAERGANERYRIVLAGYEEYQTLIDKHGWTSESWKANGGYANITSDASRGKENRKREMLYYSPFCCKTNNVQELL